VAGLADAHSTEFARDTPHPVICLMEEQHGVEQKGGTMRLGAQPCSLTEGSRSAAAYGTDRTDPRIWERHRHRYEFNPRYRERLEAAGLVIAGTNPDSTLVEIVELADHPWFVAVQFHPEFKSKPTAAHPLFAGLVAAAVERHAGSAWVSQA
jgi:CTP synthase